jgi:hypothetical protein
MLTSGADLTEFRKNPVMLLDHNDWNLPIGRWENIRVEGTQILADAVFDMKDPRAAQVAGKVQDDFMRMASIGAWAPEETSDDDILRLPGQRGTTVTKWKVREASIVSIGANHNAVALYDKEGNRINMDDQSDLINLFDRHNFSNHQKSERMKFLLGLLKLADNASEADVQKSVQELIANNDRLKAENDALTTKVDAIAKAELARRKSEAVGLVDAAVKDGRIDAKSRESYLTLFDKDFDAAKAVIEAIPVRQSLAAQIGQAQTQTGSATELSDLQGKTVSDCKDTN